MHEGATSISPNVSRLLRPYLHSAPKGAHARRCWCRYSPVTCMCASHCSWVTPHLKANGRGERRSPGSARRNCAREPRHARGVRYAVFASVCYAVAAAEAAAAASAPDAPGAAEASASNTRATGRTRFGGAPVSAPRRARARASAERQAVAHSCATLRCLSKLEEEAESPADAGKIRCMRAALQKGAEPFADSK